MCLVIVVVQVRMVIEVLIAEPAVGVSWALDVVLG